MFHKAKTEAERQKIFDDYFLTLLKKKEVIKKNKKIIDEQEFTFDPTMDENKVKGAFNSYVDSLVVKNFLIEQIYSRLNISKSMALNFVSKLDGNQVLILSKVVNEFIKDIQERYVSINDYILKTRFDELQTNYNVIQQQEKNEDIIKQNQVEQGQILQENIPAEELAEVEVDNNEEKQMIDFLYNTIFKLSGSTTLGTSKNQIMKTLLGQFVYKNPDAFEDSKMKAKSLYNKFENDTLTLLARRDDKRDARLEF